MADDDDPERIGDLVDDALELIQETFPGATVEESAAAEKSKRTVSAAAGSKAVDELIAAVEMMVEHFRASEPARLERDGWKLIIKTLAGAKRARQVDPEQIGGAASQANHPGTSRAAAEIVSAGTQQHMVLDLLTRAEHGATAYELAASPRFQRLRPNIPPNQVASRIDELRRMGCIEHMPDLSGAPGVHLTRDAAAGPADVHALTDHGWNEAERLGPHPQE